MATAHKLIIGDSTSMEELENESIHLIITSPPYFNAPFDYKDYFKNYDSYLMMLSLMAKEAYRVLQQGRIFVLNIDERYCFFRENDGNVSNSVYNEKGFL